MKSDVAEVGGGGGGGEARGQGEAPRPEIANRLPLALHHHRHRHRFGFGVPLSPLCVGRVFFGCTTLLELQAGWQVGIGIRQRGLQPTSNKKQRNGVFVRVARAFVVAG